MKIGEFKLKVLSGGHLWMDGGAMFGIVPKVLWEQKCHCDEHNRVELDTNCMLIQGLNHVGIVDTGYGSKTSKRERERNTLEKGHPLARSLAKEGIAVEQVDWVVLSHLHNDHAGGCTIRTEKGHLEPTFPQAKYYVQRQEWEDANAEMPELAGSYLSDDFQLLAEKNLLQVIDGDSEIMPGILVKCIGGHTGGHQIVHIRSDKANVVYLADLCPFTLHLSMFWSMAYDQFQLAVRRTKREILSEAVAKEWLVTFSHDPSIKAAYLARDAKGNIVVSRSVDI